MSSYCEHGTYVDPSKTSDEVCQRCYVEPRLAWVKAHPDEAVEALIGSGVLDAVPCHHCKGVGKRELFPNQWQDPCRFCEGSGRGQLYTLRLPTDEAYQDWKAQQCE